MRALLLAAAIRKEVAPVPPSVLRAIAVGSDGVLAMEFGNNVWDKTQAPPGNHRWVSVETGGGKIVAVSYDGSIAHRDIAGGSWTVGTVPIAPDSSWRAVHYVNGRFYVIGGNSVAARRIVHSADLVTWTSIIGSADYDYDTFNTAKFKNTILIPGFGQSMWTINTRTTAVQSNGIAFGSTNYYRSLGVLATADSIFVCGQGGKVSKYGSTDADGRPSSPSLRTGQATSKYLRAMALNPTSGLMVGVGSVDDPDTGDPLMKTSVDAGVTWTEVSQATLSSKLGVANSLTSIVFDGTAFKISTRLGDIYRSTDLNTFVLEGNLGAPIWNILKVA
ncbi:hypothetical protein D3C78_950780 [compost metagenome]